MSLRYAVVYDVINRELMFFPTSDRHASFIRMQPV